MTLTQNMIENLLGKFSKNGLAAKGISSHKLHGMAKHSKSARQIRNGLVPMKKLGPWHIMGLVETKSLC